MMFRGSKQLVLKPISRRKLSPEGSKTTSNNFIKKYELMVKKAQNVHQARLSDSWLFATVCSLFPCLPQDCA